MGTAPDRLTDVLVEEKIDVRRFLSALVVAALFGFVVALDLPSEGEVTVVAGDGTVVGVGELEDGQLELELVSGFADFATLTIVDADGNVVSVDVMIAESGAVTLTDTLEDLGAVLAANGGTIEVEFDDGLAAELAEQAAEEAEEAAERAAEEAEEAAEEAEEAAERAAEEAEEAAERAAEEAEEAAEEAEEAAERAAEEAEEAAERAAGDADEDTDGDSDEDSDD